jgi:hypothetical protein
MRRVIYALLLIGATAARAGDFAPLNIHESGTQLVTDLNAKLGGQSAILPQPQCVPQPYLADTIQNHTVVVCHKCAPTNPCSLGTQDLLALGVCPDGQATCDTTTIVNGQVGQWNCNLGPPSQLHHVWRGLSYAVSAPQTINPGSSPTVVSGLSVAWSLGPSPTHYFHVRYEGAITLLANTQCDVALRNASVPVQAAEVAPAGTGGEGVVQTVPLLYDDVLPDGGGVRLDVAVLAAAGGTCTVLATGPLGLLTRMVFSAVPD